MAKKENNSERWDSLKGREIDKDIGEEEKEGERKEGKSRVLF